MSFFAVTVEPGKEAQQTLQFDLRLSNAVLPPNATDKGRSHVQVKVDEKTFTLASLKLDLHENVSLDLIFEAGSTVSFTVAGKNPVQLSGYYMDVNQGELEDFSDDDLDELDDEDLDEDDLDEIDDDEEISSSGEEEITQASLQALANNKRKIIPTQQANGGKKPKTEAAQPPAQAQKPQEQKPQEQKPQEQKPKPQQKQQEPKAVTPKAEQAPQKAQQQQQQQKQQTPKADNAQQPKAQQQQKAQTPVDQKPQGQNPAPTILSNGLKIEVLQAGSGTATATPGKKVGVSYIGRLTNGKKFDESKSPFQFKLGAGEVISGWDHGVSGMKIGEKRRLTIPPALGYGKAGAPPDIPKNATLVFEVTLLRL